MTLIRSVCLSIRSVDLMYRTIKTAQRQVLIFVLPTSIKWKDRPIEL